MSLFAPDLGAEAIPRDTKAESDHGKTDSVECG